MANFSLCFGQKNSKNIYNLFYLSKMMADENLDDIVKTETYYAIFSLIPKADIPNTTRTFTFITQIKEHYKNQNLNSLKSIIEDINKLENFENEIKQRYPDKFYENLSKLFIELKNDVNKTNCINNAKKITESLELYYDKTEFDNINKKCSSHSFSLGRENENTIFIDKDKLKKVIDSLKNNGQIDPAINTYTNNPDILKSEYSDTEYFTLKKNLIKININIDSFSKKNVVFINKNKLIANLYKEEQDTNKTKDEAIKKLSEKLAALQIEDSKINEVSKNISSIDTSTKIATPQQIIINSQIQTAQAQSGSSGISIPSQSQMIEAMAIFLAKRAKQEAAIWFMDQIRLKMNNPIIFDVFPETIKVLEGVENYKVPTFNTTWKYAIAKDFVEMPRNLVKSPWVEKVIIKDSINHARLRQSVEFGYDLNRLITEQYNYRDIIKYFYINPRLEKEKNGKDKVNQDINRLIDNSTTLLYIVTNELFSIDNIEGKDRYRLLSYEEVAGLSPKEYEIFLELIDLKYGERINDSSIIKNLKSTKQEEVNKWIGNILTSLSQFDKIRNEYKTQKEEIKDDLASKNFYNVWSVLNQLTTNLYNDKLFTSPKIKDIKTKLEWVQTGMSIYEHFQNNDYVGAANETFGLMNIMKTNFIDEKKYKHYYYSFGSNKKISVNYDGKSFTIKGIKYISKDDTPNFEEDFVQVYFLEKDSLYFRIKNSQEFCISKKDLNEFLIISSYTAKNKNERIKLLEELLKRFKNKNLETLAKTLKVDQSQIIQLINYIQIAKTTINTDKTNIDEVFKKMDFNFVKEQSLNIISTYNDKYTKQLTNLLSFFGDVLTVKDEHQLAGVIDSYALPPTSYKLKRKQPSSIDLNAYVGAFGGYLASFKSSLIDPQLVYGITAPIGVAFTWSRDGWFDNYGFTVDALDLGNVVNHYLVKPKEDYPKEVHFSEVFSLGTTFLMGIKNSPFVLSGGFRFQPYNTGKDGNNKVFDAGIFHLGVKIDIPLIHLSGKDF